MKRRGFRILKITVIAVLLYFAYTMAKMVVSHTGFAAWLSEVTLVEVGKVLLLNKLDLIGAGHLWFLPALLYVYGIWYLVIKAGFDGLLYKLLPVLFLFNIIMVVGVNTLDWSWHIYGNFLVSALPYFVCGNCIAAREAKLKRVSDRVLVTALLAGCAVIVVFTLWPLPVGITGIGTIPLAVSLFMLAVRHPGRSNGSALEALGSKISLYVYIFHILVAKVLRKIIRLAGMNTESTVYKWIFPIIVVVISIVLGTMIYLVKNTVQSHTIVRDKV